MIGTLALSPSAGTPAGLATTGGPQPRTAPHSTTDFATAVSAAVGDPASPADPTGPSSTPTATSSATDPHPAGKDGTPDAGDDDPHGVHPHDLHPARTHAHAKGRAIVVPLDGPATGAVPDPNVPATGSPSAPVPGTLPSPETTPSGTPQTAALGTSETAALGTAAAGAGEPTTVPSLQPTPLGEAAARPGPPTAPTTAPSRAPATAPTAPRPGAGTAPAPAEVRPTILGAVRTAATPGTSPRTEGHPSAARTEPAVAGALVTGAPIGPAPAAAPSTPSTATTDAPPRTAPAVAAQLLDPVRGAAQLAGIATSTDGEHRMTVALHPADLGRVDVQVIVRDGAVMVHLHAHDDAGHLAVTAGSAALHDALSRHGLRPVEIVVGPPDAATSSHGPGTTAGGDSRSGGRPDDGTAAGPQAGTGEGEARPRTSSAPPSGSDQGDPSRPTARPEPDTPPTGRRPHTRATVDTHA